MPRKPRCRNIGGYPDYWTFTPEETSSEEAVVMSLDELETIRLIDYDGKTQEECARQMEVARTTVTAIYDSARRKIASALIDGKRLQIRGGTYRVTGRYRIDIHEKGMNVMRIAVTYEDGKVFQHFGHTEQFKIYDIEDGTIKDAKVVDTNGSGHGALAGFLKAAEVDTLICGGIGMGAQMALEEAGIKLYGGVSGDADAVVEALLSGNLSYDPDAKCDHHENHGEHECGEHGCGHHEGHSCHHGQC